MNQTLVEYTGAQEISLTIKMPGNLVLMDDLISGIYEVRSCQVSDGHQNANY